MHSGARCNSAPVRRSGLVVIFAVALAARLGVVAATPGYVPLHDDHDYDRLGWAMASGDGYPAIHLRGRSYAVAYRPPLWPAALGAVYALTGHRLIAARI